MLKIDPETALSAYVQQTSPPQDDKGETFTKFTIEQKKSKFTYILVPLALVLFGLILFFALHSPKKEDETAQTPVKPEQVIPSPIVEQPEEIPEMPVEIKEPVPDTAAPIENNVDVEKAPHTLKIVATDIVWLLITIDDTAPKEMTLKLGETATFQAQKGFSLKLGNAGGVKVLFDGKDIGNLGDKGQVVKLNLSDLL